MKPDVKEGSVDDKFEKPVLRAWNSMLKTMIGLEGSNEAKATQRCNWSKREVYSSQVVKITDDLPLKSAKELEKMPQGVALSPHEKQK